MHWILGHFLIFILNGLIVISGAEVSMRSENSSSSNKGSDSATKQSQFKVKWKNIASLQNSVAQAYIVVESRSGQFTEIKLVGITNNRDQNSAFIMEYDERPELGKSVQATIQHLTSRKYLSPDGNNIVASVSEYKWNITEIGGGDILISVPEVEQFGKYISCDESNNLILEQVDKSIIENTGKLSEGVKRYQWSRILAAYVSHDFARKIAAVLKMPISSDN